MNIEELILICKERNELDFLYLITKQVADTDSIGEGWSYCYNYPRKVFNNAVKHNDDKYCLEGQYCNYLEKAGLPIYEIYLKQIKAII